jgi:UDP:flavonoid glycosyltransferase YjiC (YdhE family)
LRIAIVTLGSRGDVQPYLALAVGVQRAGHTVTLVAPATFAEWIQSYGVAVTPVRFNPQAVMQELGKGRGGFRTIAALLNALKTGMQESQAQVWQAAQQCDYFIQSATGMGALEVAAARGIPSALAYLFPMQATRAWPMIWFPWRFSFGGAYNLFTHWLMNTLLWQVGGAMANQWRKQFGLKPWRSYSEALSYARQLRTPHLYAYSPHVLPKPADWDDDQHLTGYWFLESPFDWQPSADLLAFLEGGPPPIYIGFGSLNMTDGAAHTRRVLQALESSGQRGLLLTGWGGLTRQSAPANVYSVENVPHDWLFPRVAAVMHHGGAGSTGGGLRAGVPSLITPFAGDQILWAERVAQLGVGPRLPNLKKLSAEKLAEAMQAAVHDPGMRERAAALGDKIRAEDGIARAVELIERQATERMNTSFTHHPH